MKIALVAYEFKNNHICFNINQIEKAFKENIDADLYVFGEAFLQGFDALNFEYAHDKLIATNDSSSHINSVKELTLKYGKAVMFGYFEIEEQVIYSSYCFIDNGQLIYNYRRISQGWRYKEMDDYRHYDEGKELLTFEFMNQTLTVALCGDLWEFPSLFKSKGILIWPVYVNFDLDQQMLNQYAKQAQLCASKTVLVNSLSHEPFSKGGAAYFQDGEVIESLVLEKEGILVVEV